MENCKDERLKFEKCEANSGEAPAEQGGVPQETSEIFTNVPKSLILSLDGRKAVEGREGSEIRTLNKGVQCTQCTLYTTKDYAW